MARARNIKPGFFKNEQLADLPFEYRILFQGLWCEADRDGRLEDRPKRIKAEVFPYDAVDVDTGLNALQAAGFIVRYDAGGRRCIEVLNFAKHQNPHKKEAASSLPARVAEIPVPVREIPGRAGLIPDSLNLIPDSLIEDCPTPGSRPPTPRKRTAKPEGVTLNGWLEGLEGDAVPSDDPIFAWAAKQAIPADWLGYAWAAFEDRYLDKDKTYTDWRAAFRDHVKRGWLDIWRADQRNGGFVLTTVGEQWRREVSA